MYPKYKYLLIYMLLWIKFLFDVYCFSTLEVHIIRDLYFQMDIDPFFKCLTVKLI